MSREIKFRAWDINKKVFIPTERFSVTTSNFSYFAIMIEDWEDYKLGEFMYPVSQTLSQFTGLTDKNGTEIYEGDIVSVPYVTPMGQLTDVEDEDRRASVGFKNGSFVLVYPKTDNVPLIKWCKQKQGNYVPNYGNKTVIENTTIVTIIGNIYENPELLST